MEEKSRVSSPPSSIKHCLLLFFWLEQTSSCITPDSGGGICHTALCSGSASARVCSWQNHPNPGLMLMGPSDCRQADRCCPVTLVPAGVHQPCPRAGVFLLWFCARQRWGGKPASGVESRILLPASLSRLVQLLSSCPPPQMTVALVPPHILLCRGWPLVKEFPFPDVSSHMPPAADIWSPVSC